MKKKDIAALVVCVCIIIGSVTIILRTLTKSPVKVQQAKETIQFTGNINNDEIEKLKQRKDYGVPNMDNIGRDNPFASL